MSPVVYLDNNATTCVDPQVLEALLPFLQQGFGNASSSHALGQQAKHAINQARQQIAAMLHAEAPDQEIVFMSGGTETINFVIKGLAFKKHKQQQQKLHLITSVIEHVAVLETSRFLEEMKLCDVTYLPVDATGRVAVQDVVNAIRPNTFLVTIMHANNEVGTLQPIREIVQAVKTHPLCNQQDPILVHTDASQSIGKTRVSVQDMGVDFLTIAGHKLYAPKGIGALYMRQGASVPDKLIHGANHEFGKRAGTENVAFDVALGKACELIHDNLDQYEKKLHSLKMALLEGIKSHIEGTGIEYRVNGHPEHVLPNTLSISFKGVRASQVLPAIENEVYASAGSACHSGDQEHISYVLQSMGMPEEFARGTLRLSVGRFTTLEEVQRAARVIADAVKHQLGF